MSWPLLSAREGLKKIRENVPALDVRSPGEFVDGFIPGFRNVAILNDDHRHQVGLTYKHEGNQKAVELGHRLVDPLRADLVEQWRQAFAGREGLVCCWRGGQRSEISARWMEEAGLRGLRVHHGYKGMRRVLLEEIARPREWIVVGGLTGSGKTELLQRLDSARVLDLEALACHRGSSFGGFLDRPQPSQQTFENAIGLHLFENPAALIVENESSMIGRCALPETIRRGIEEGQVIRLIAGLEERVERVFQEYVAEPVKGHGVEPVRLALRGSIGRISKALGGVRAAELLRLLDEAFAAELSLESHWRWIEFLFVEYYDPRYQYGIRRDERKVLLEGCAKAVLEFLTRQRPYL